MTNAVQSIISSFPVSVRWVPSCMENLIDKKLSGAALNVLQKLVHHLLSWLYYPYQALYKQKAARIHYFSDGETRLFDMTKLGQVKIEFEWKRDFLTFNGRRVLFSRNPNIEVVFSRKTFTDYLIIKDEERRPGWYKLVEQEFSRAGNRKPMEKSWFLDTTRFTQHGGHSVYFVDHAFGKI